MFVDGKAAAAVMVGGVVVAAALSFPPPGRQGVPAPGDAPGRLIADDDTAVAARVNSDALDRMLIESARTGVPVVLPAGTFHFQKAVYIRPEHSGAQLVGAGARRTVLKNAGTTSPYIDNCTLSVLGDSRRVGYAEDWDSADLVAGSLHFPPRHDMTVYAPGRSLYLYRWDSYYPDKDGVNFRVRIASVHGTTVRFDRPAASGPGTLAQCNKSKYLDGYPIKDAAEGTDLVTFLEPGDAAHYAAGTDVLLTNGASKANEASGELRRVIGVDATGGTVKLDRPARRTWRAATLVRMAPVADVRIADLTVGEPVNRQSNPLFVKFAVRLKLERVGLAGRLQANLAGSADVTVTDSDNADAGYSVNNCHDVLIRGGTIGGLYFEESCNDIDVRSLTLRRPGGMVHGFCVNGTGCQRVRARDVQVFGSGLKSGGGHGGGFVGGGKECEFTDCLVAGSYPGGAMYLSGDRLQIRGLRSDQGITMTAGRDISLSNVTAPSLELRANASGDVYACEGVKPQRGWRVR